MNRNLYTTLMLLLMAITFGGFSFADGGGGMGAGSGGGGVGAGAGGGMGGGGTGSGMGSGAGAGMGGDRGMMGDQGHWMTGRGQNYSNPRREQPRANPTYRQSEKNETARLRSEIREKRQELSELYHSEKPNKEMINQKIAELDELEAKLDEKLSGNN